MTCSCSRPKHRATKIEPAWFWPAGTRVEAVRAYQSLPIGTIATVTWPMPEGARIALGVMPPFAPGSAVPIAWEFEGDRWFMFCDVNGLREVAS